MEWGNNVRYLIIIGILGCAYLATAFATYAPATPIPIGTFTTGEFWLWGDSLFAIPFASIFAGILVWIALRMRRGLDDEQRFRQRQRELGISDEWE